MKTGEKGFGNAMAFYHRDGLVAAWKQAMKFAGKGGRIATMPDIVDARLETKPSDAPWETYYTTLSAEYLGFSKATGKRILIVAHGIGPMSTLDGILKAYSWEFKDKSRNRRGGRITQQEFWDLEVGKYGEVEIVDFENYCQCYEYPFIEILRSMRAGVDPVLKARFGFRAKEYVAAHAEYARAWHRVQAGIDPENKYDLPNNEEYLDRRRCQHMKDGAEDSNPYIIQIEGAANCSYGCQQYGYRPIEEGYAMAHLLSTGRLVNMHHEGNESLVLDVSCHEWWNGTRVVGIKANTNSVTGIQAGPDARRLLHKHWQELFESSGLDCVPDGLFVLMQMPDKTWFTQFQKKGASADSYEPEFCVTSMKKVGELARFYTESNYPVPIFRYDIREAQAVLPKEANAYELVGDPTKIGGADSQETCLVQGYCIEIDHTKRLVRQDVLTKDYDRMMEFLEKKGKAV